MATQIRYVDAIKLLYRIPHAAKKQLGITDQTFYRWRTRCGSLKEDEAKRLQILEQNARLKRIIAGARRGHDSRCGQCAGGGGVARDGI